MNIDMNLVLTIALGIMLGSILLKGLHLLSTVIFNKGKLTPEKAITKDEFDHDRWVKEKLLETE